MHVSILYIHVQYKISILIKVKSTIPCGKLCANFLLGATVVNGLGISLTDWAVSPGLTEVNKKLIRCTPKKVSNQLWHYLTKLTLMELEELVNQHRRRRWVVFATVTLVSGVLPCTLPVFLANLSTKFCPALAFLYLEFCPCIKMKASNCSKAHNHPRKGLGGKGSP